MEIDEADWSLDTAGVRVQHVADGLLLDIDAVKARRSAMAIGGTMTAVGLAIIILIPDFQRWFGLLFVGFGLAFALRKPPTGDCRVTRDGIASTMGDARSVPVAEVEHVRLERREVVRGSGKNRRTVVEWPVRIQGPGWFLANGRDRKSSRRLAEDIAIVLGKPFVDATGAVETIVPADAVNLGVRERVRQGVVKVEPPGSPPAPIAVRDTPHGREYVVPHRNIGRIIGAGIPAAFLLWGAYTAAQTLLPLAGDEGLALLAWFPALLGLAGVALLLVAVSGLVGEDWVRVTPAGVEYGLRRFGAGRTRLASLDGVEDIRGMRGIHLVGDDVDVDVGFARLAPEAQAWLAQALLYDLARGSAHA